MAKKTSAVKSAKGTFLKGCVIAVSGLPPGSNIATVKRKIKGFGGTVSEGITDETTHLLAAESNRNKPTKIFTAAKTRYEEGETIVILTYEWLEACEEAGKKVSVDNFVFDNEEDSANDDEDDEGNDGGDDGGDDDEGDEDLVSDDTLPLDKVSIALTGELPLFPAFTTYRKAVEKLGGHLGKKVVEKTGILCTTQDEVDADSTDVKAASAGGLPVVGHSWLKDTIKAGRPEEIEDHLLRKRASSVAGGGSAQMSDLERLLALPRGEPVTTSSSTKDNKIQIRDPATDGFETAKIEAALSTGELFVSLPGNEGRKGFIVRGSDHAADKASYLQRHTPLSSIKQDKYSSKRLTPKEVAIALAGTTNSGSKVMLLVRIKDQKYLDLVSRTVLGQILGGQKVADEIIESHTNRTGQDSLVKSKGRGRLRG